MSVNTARTTTFGKKHFNSQKEFLSEVRRANAEFREEHPKIWVKYFRQGRRPKGIFVGYLKDDMLHICFSKCSSKDRWNRDKAFFYATRRPGDWAMINGYYIEISTPHYLQQDLMEYANFLQNKVLKREVAA